MAQPGVQQDDGTFNRQTLEEIEERIEAKAKEEFGENVDLSQGSPIKQLLDVVILEHEHVWKLLEDVYYSAYYGHAYEEQLDNILALTQFSRIPRRGATGEVTFGVNVANDEDVVIPEGTRLSTYETDNRPPIEFKTTEPARLRAGEAAVSGVPIRAVQPWESELAEEWLGAETNVGANTIETFETPIRGVDWVTNPHPTGSASREEGYSYIEGRDRETDAEFRRRYEQEIGANAAASLDALRSAVLELDGIRNADIEENVDDEPDDEGRPPKSFELTVLGDENPDVIAQAITDTRSAGIEAYGEEAGVGITDDGKERTQRFSWASEVPVYVNVEITHDADFPADGSLQVEDAIVEYIGGETADGTEFPGTGMGEDVVYDLVWKEAINVTGVWGVDLEIGDDEADMGASDLTIEDLDTAMTSHTDVNVFTSQQERP